MSTPTPQPTWQDECHRAAAIFDAGDHQGALDIFNAICNRPDLDPSSKTMMYYNVAAICEKMGNHAGSMKAFDNARQCSLQQYLYIEQARAVYLIRVNRHDEAAKLIEELLKHDSLTREARDACESNLKVAQQYGKPSAATGTARYSEAPRASFSHATSKWLFRTHHGSGGGKSLSRTAVQGSEEPLCAGEIRDFLER